MERRARASLIRLGLTLMMVMLCAAQDDWDQRCGPQCKCKWVSGKKTAECIRQNMSSVPSDLSSEIQILDLTGNRIPYLSHDAFSVVKLVNLHKLVLRECDIETINTNAFNGLEIVIEIDLSANRIKKLFPGTFDDTKRLRALLLNHNSLEYLDNEQFHDLKYLQKVILNDNRLTRIGERAFRNLPNLQMLTLHGNNLTMVKYTYFQNLTKLSSLELHNNPWNCNCQLKRFRDWTIERKLYTRPTNCSLPAGLAGKMWDEVSSDDFACRPKVTVGPHTRLETTRGDVKLWCRATGIPRPHLSWVHRARVLNNSTRRHGNGDRAYALSERGEWLNLTIPDVTTADKGDYICMAKNPGGSVERNVSVSVIGDAIGGTTNAVSLPLALGLGVTFLLLLLVTLALCVWYCRKRRPRHDEKSAEAASLEHHGLGEQEKSLITAINPVVKPPRRYEAPSVTSHGTEMTELNRTLLDNDSVFADGPGSVVGVGGGGGGGGGGVGGVMNGGPGDEERERHSPDLDVGSMTRGVNYRQYPPDLLAFSGGRGASPTSQASTAPDSSRLTNPHQPMTMSSTSTPQQQQQHQQSMGFGSPTSGQYPAAFKTLPHNRSTGGGASSTSSQHYSSGGLAVMPRHGYVTIPRRPRAPSWSSGPPTSPTSAAAAEGLEPVYDNLGLRTTADGSSVLSLNKSPEPGAASASAASIMRGRPLPGTPTGNPHYATIQRSTPNILTGSPHDRSAPEGAPEWPMKLPDEMMDTGHRQSIVAPGDSATLGRKVPPRPPPKPKKRSPNGPLYEDEGEDGTEV